MNINFADIFGTDDLVGAVIKWQGHYRGVRWEIQHHGIAPYNPKGIFCGYIYIDSYRFDANREAWDVKGEFNETFNRMVFDYYSLPSLNFPGGITYSERLPHPLLENEFMLKLGCDYNHSWDRDSGFPATRLTVEHDLRLVIDQLITEHNYRSAA